MVDFRRQQRERLRQMSGGNPAEITNDSTTNQLDEDALNFAAHLMVEQHKSHNETHSILIEHGLDKESATNIVSAVQNRIEEHKQDEYTLKQEAARKDMVRGGLWCGLGIVVTIGSYAMASGGGHYVVAWGAIIFGGIQFFRGLMNTE